MMLSELIDGLEGAELSGDGSIPVGGVQTDSRRVSRGDLFVAIPGFETDGARFIDAAIDKGAAAIVTEAASTIDAVPAVRVPDARKAAAHIASRFHGNPSARLHLIGVTGTSGKTTTTRMIESILDQTGEPVGLIGTIEYRAGSVRESADRTTPDSVVLQEWFGRMVDNGVTRAVMEVSSHALALHRTWSVEYDVAVFTNLSRDHFDFHESFEDYFAAKRLLFDQIPEEGVAAVVNADDEYGRRLIADLGADRVVSFGFGEECAVRPSEGFHVSLEGLHGMLQTPWGEVSVSSPLIGRPNLYNWMGAVAASLASGIAIETVERGIEALATIPGRFERVGSGTPAVIVDYAHKPDAIEKLLDSVAHLSPGSRIIVAFGCGGDRDQGKRPLMGRSAATRSDVLVLTSDNPRSEDPEAIIQDIVKGIEDESRADVIVEPDRRKAIELAIARGGDDAVVIIAGKGHEDYQVIGDQIIHFDDREEALAVLGRKNK